MFPSPYRQILVASLSAFLKPGTNIKSSTLLMAYATFSSINEKDLDSFISSFNIVNNTEPTCQYRSLLLQKTITKLPEAYLKVNHLFASLSPSEFFRFIIPDLVSDPIKASKILHKKFSDDILLFAHHILRINIVIHSNDVINLPKNKNTLDILYNVYQEKESITEIRLKKSDFEELYSTACLYPLDSEELKLRSLSSEIKKLNTAIDILSNQLDVPRKEQVDVVCQFFTEYKQAKELVETCSIYNFTKTKNSDERKKLLYTAIKNFAMVPPLDFLCAVLYYKKTGGKHFSENSLIPNDITLENGLIYTLFTSHAIFNPTEEKDIFIFFPSPFFIRKWLEDPIAKSKKTTFVFRDASVKELINFYYNDGTYVAPPGNNIKFLTYTEWQEQVEIVPLTNAAILLFASDMLLKSQNEWFQNIKYYSNDRVDIFALIPSFEFEQASSPFSAELRDPHIHMSTIVTIPQGINNSTSPRRKIFLHCSFSKETAVSTDTTIHAFTLNTDLKTQALSKLIVTPVIVKQQDFTSLDCSIRELFRKELLERKSSGKKNASAIPLEFTPDITIWVSKSYPKDNRNRPRLEAYVCTPTSGTDNKNHGKSIDRTKKHTTKIPESNIFEWLENDYPFSTIQARRSSEEISSSDNDSNNLKPEQHIKDVIIEHYKPHLKKKNIALKTFWYMHPELESTYSAKNYIIFESIAKSEIGIYRVADFAPEFCEELLLSYFPNDTREDLLHKLKVLSAALDKAVVYGYGEKNLLRPLIKDIRKNNKLFSQVRSALTKKHFTEAELLQAYHIIKEKLDNDHTEYLGVMIRLLTGLDSNTVCALKWKDIVKIPEYTFSKIVVTRQVTNDGKEEKGFDKLEDYLCFPCSLLLQKHLNAQLTKAKRVVPDWTNHIDLPIVTTAENLQSNKNRYSAFPPSSLDRLCREVISLLSIPDHIIEIPDKEKGTKETNLSHYGGDFFRENFRYWALNKAKFTIDEVLYLIGNKPETTFGIFYCDYLNDASQLVLYTKLLRLDTLFSENRDTQVSYEEIHAPNIFNNKYIPSSPEPLQLRIRLKLPKGQDSAIFDASCQNGMNTYIAPIISKNNKEDESWKM